MRLWKDLSYIQNNNIFTINVLKKQTNKSVQQLHIIIFAKETIF